MGTLREQLLKSGLITEKDAKQSAHQKRLDTKQAGRGELEKQARAAEKEANRQAEERKARDKRLNEQTKIRQAEKESGIQDQQRRSAALTSALENGVLANWEGNRRFYFQDGKMVEFLMVKDEVARHLESGKAAIIRRSLSGSEYLVIHAGAARPLKESAPGHIVLFHD